MHPRTPVGLGPAGRFAPSPSGDLHLGNLRTALLAWLFARSTGRAFLVRMEDLDRVRPGAAERQLADLAAIGLTWDGPVTYQSDRASGYRAAIERLTARGLTYECFCTRREIREAASAPHPDPAFPHRLGADGAYPGTCRSLTPDQIAARRQPDGRARCGYGQGSTGGPSPTCCTVSSPGRWTIWCCAATTGWRRTTWRSWWTTPRRAWTRWSAVTTC